MVKKLFIAVVNQINITSLMAIVGRATLQTCRNIGFVESKILGNNGTFPYPKEDLYAWARIFKCQDT